MLLPKFSSLFLMGFGLLSMSLTLNAQQVATTFVEQTGYLLYLPEEFRADVSAWQWGKW